MLLSDHDLLAAMIDGELVVTPFDQADLQPASIDVHLDNKFRAFAPTPYGPIHIIPGVPQPNLTDAMTIEEGKVLVLLPGEFVLGSTIEKVGMGNGLAARLEGKSSLGRLGLLTHVTAGFIDPGFQGQITLELCNLADRPMVLTPGMKIGQLCVFRMTSDAMNPYGTPGLGSHYQGQLGPTASRSGQVGV